ncbi:helix-turn-helix domain-containing protein [Enterobacteriaceae bacterium H20N1]|uniref:Helix-turn-helix domain-containing protein n=1 Tax=Dryocola boscaweniae TaxID=2925397 RepID=A0A9X2W982_9ENTR|nr:helix-turn-helix domain-containing protein [Dryocola boscaweniae]MCT4703284.1 helix-turn-helix domain-containing protein [Dryocola boscaweniae]MCT4715676.1 helix-turn-helix domain-containing protein [Dryocola boscaweniae]MCT4720452.1 helix-turn-helix domain-containing protein [Dryocola boscaweniae]
MTTSAPVRPDDSITRLLDVLQPISTPIEVVPRKRLHWDYKGRAQFYLFLKGEVSVLRASDGLVIATAYDPHLFGIAEGVQPLHWNILRIETESTIMRVDAQKAMETITANNLWQDVAIMMSYFTSYLFYRDALVVQQRTYSVIRDHLLEMMQLPEETRLRVSILEYIQDRTHLSRSSVLNMVFSLKESKHIETKRGGYLLSMKDLPESF